MAYAPYLLIYSSSIDALTGQVANILQDKYRGKQPFTVTFTPSGNLE